MFALGLLSSVLGLQCVPAYDIELTKIAVQGEVEFAIKALDVDLETLKLFNISDPEPVRKSMIIGLQEGLKQFGERTTNSLDDLEKSACADCDLEVRALETFVSLLHDAMEAVDKDWQTNKFFEAINDVLAAVEGFAKKACPEPADTLKKTAEPAKTTADPKLLATTTPKPVTTKKPVMCLAGDEVKAVVNALDDVLQGAKNGLKEAEKIRLVGKAAKVASEAVAFAEHVLNIEAPKVELAICADCRHLEKLFTLVKAEIEKVVGKTGNNAIERTVGGILNAVDNALMFACPPKPLLEAAECLAQTQVESVLDEAEDVLAWAESVLAEAAKINGTVGVYAEMLLPVVEEARTDLAADAPKIIAQTCAVCQMLEVEIEGAKAKIVAYLETLGCPELVMWGEELLKQLDATLATECATTAPKTTGAPKTTTAAPVTGPKLEHVVIPGQVPDHKCLAVEVVTEIFGSAEIGVSMAVNYMKGLEKKNNGTTIAQYAAMAANMLEAQEANLKAQAVKAEANACANCETLLELITGVSKKVEAAVAKMNNPMVTATITGLLNKGVLNLGKHCAPTTTAPAAFFLDEADEGQCVAGAEVETRFTELNMFLKEAAKEVARLPEDDAKYLVKGIENAEKVLATLASKLANKACTACVKLESIFKAVSDEILKVVDDIKCPELEDTVEKVVKMIDSGFKMMCSPKKTTPKPVVTTTTPAPTDSSTTTPAKKAMTTTTPKALEEEADDCVAGNKVLQTVDQLDKYLGDAADVIKDFIDNAAIGAEAKLLENAVRKAQQIIQQIIPGIAKDVCASCEDLENVFSIVSKEVMKVVDSIKSQDIEEAASKILKTVDNGLTTLCPSATIFERC